MFSSSTNHDRPSRVAVAGWSTRVFVYFSTSTSTGRLTSREEKNPALKRSHPWIPNGPCSLCTYAWNNYSCTDTSVAESLLKALASLGRPLFRPSLPILEPNPVALTFWWTLNSEADFPLPLGASDISLPYLFYPLPASWLSSDPATFVSLCTSRERVPVSKIRRLCDFICLAVTSNIPFHFRPEIDESYSPPKLETMPSQLQ